MRSLPRRAGADAAASAGAAGTPAGCPAERHPHGFAEKAHPYGRSRRAGGRRQYPPVGAVRRGAGVLDGQPQHAGDGGGSRDLALQQKGGWRKPLRAGSAGRECPAGDRGRVQLGQGIHHRPGHAVYLPRPPCRADKADRLRDRVHRDRRLPHPVLAVECADGTRYYSDGQQVERFIAGENPDGTVRYGYGTEEQYGHDFKKG